MKMPKFKLSNAQLLVLIIFFGAALRLIFNVGVIITGDSSTVYAAHTISVGDYKLSANALPTTTRIGFVYPVAFFYRIFGVSEFSSYLFSFITSISSIILIYFLGKLFFNEKVGMLSAFLLSFFPLHVIYATEVFSDLSQAFFSGLAVYFFFLGEKKQQFEKQWHLYALSGFSVGISFLVKEIGIIIFFFFGVYGLYKLFFRKEKFRYGYFFILLGFLIVLLLELLHSYVISNDLLLRFHQMDNTYPAMVSNLFNYTGYKLFERLFVHMPYMMLTNIDFGFFTLFVIMAMMYLILFRKKDTYVTIIWYVSLFLYLNFGTVSLKTYVPLVGGFPRYLEILTFPGIMLIAYFLLEKDATIRKFIRPFAIIFLLLTSFGFIYINPDRHNADIERELGKFFLKARNLPIYADESTKSALDFFTGYRQDIRSYWKGNYPKPGGTDLIKPEEIRNAYVVVNKRIFNKTPANYMVTYPSLYYGTPNNWIIVKTIKNSEGDALIYYVP